jgi:hypothetical protein
MLDFESEQTMYIYVHMLEAIKIAYSTRMERAGYRQ